MYKPVHKHPGFVGMGCPEMHSERADTTGEKKTNLSLKADGECTGEEEMIARGLDLEIS